MSRCLAALFLLAFASYLALMTPFVQTRLVTYFADLLGKRLGDTVNLECDVIGKYVEKLLGPHQEEPGGITMEFLAQNGF